MFLSTYDSSSTHFCFDIDDHAFIAFFQISTPLSNEVFLRVSKVQNVDFDFLQSGKPQAEHHIALHCYPGTTVVEICVPEHGVMVGQSQLETISKRKISITICGVTVVLAMRDLYACPSPNRKS
jgi:hypothetical protein